MKEPVIEFHDFSFRYKSQTEDTLKNINLTIYKGEKVLILGPSGSGKSTIGNCINGLIPFSMPGEIRGSLKVAGIETKNADIFTLSSHVGTVQQDSDAQFIGLSVGEDIAFSLENDAVPRQEMLKRVQQAAAVVGMEQFLDEVPYSLSGGQKQRVALAGVLHNDVDVLLFDEPLAALDPAMGMKAVDLIDRIYRDQKKTVVIIEHRLEDVLYRSVDRVIVLADGEIRLDTTPNELLRMNVLKQMGIREPLYISALRNAGVQFTDRDELESVERLDMERCRPLLKRHFEERRAEKKKADKGEPILEVQDVSFSYGDFQALKHVSFSAARGERISIIGKNGAGKSTLAKLLCGIVRPSAGRVLLQGKDCSALSIRELGHLIGYVMQNPNQMIVKDIILDEVKLAMKLNGDPEEEQAARAEEVLRMCDLYGMRNWPVSVLSYGQKKRVTIASILCLHPEIIIVDEPTAGQDYRHYTEIMQFLTKLNRDYGITILFITHDMHLAIEYTDRALVFADGELIADDAVFRVLSSPDVITRASLKETSLAVLARRAGLPAEEFIESFIQEERKERE